MGWLCLSKAQSIAIGGNNGVRRARWQSIAAARRPTILLDFLISPLDKQVQNTNDCITITELLDNVLNWRCFVLASANRSKQGRHWPALTATSTAMHAIASKQNVDVMRLAASKKFLTRLIGFSPWIMAPWTPHFRMHQLLCFWHETIPVRSADHEVVARYHGSRCHFFRLVLRARPMIFGGKEKAEISGHAGYHSHVIIYEYMY
jgi:hypothetical protein